MYTIDFSKKIHVHFAGIGGISMSALAEILLDKGFTVSGSDAKESELTKRLESLGVRFFLGQRESNIKEDVDLVVYTAALKEDNPELIAAKEKNIPLLTRAQFVGQIMKNHKIAIGVSGTHGKTTTTSMLSEILMEDEQDPTILVGGFLKSLHGNLRIGHSDVLVTEACEYTNSFLSFAPTVEIILNVCEDHMDFFKDIEDIRNSFKAYTKLLPKDGTLIINGDIPDVDFFTNDLDCNVITFGKDPKTNTYSATNISYDKYAHGSYDLTEHGEIIEHIQLSVSGLHNIYNSLSTIACARSLGVTLPVIKQGLSSYTGTDRRFQLKGEACGVTIIDDYAHHPDEIRATLETAKKYPHKSIWCVFQPHTYTRTKAFLTEFAEALSLADNVVLADIYAAREKDTLGISSVTLLNELKKLNVPSYYFPSFDEIENFLLENCKEGDLLITMGAGDIVLVGERLIGA